MRIVLVAEESAGLHVLRWILASEHELIGVLSGDEDERPSPLASVASQANVPVKPAALVRDPALGDWLKRERVDLLLNVHSLFRIADEVVRAPRIGAFNLHPGPLPRYAGLNAPSWAIYHGETQHGVTVHWMTSEIDAGAIAYQESLEIGPDDTGLSLSLKCIRSGVPLVTRLVDDASRDERAIPRHVQDPRQRTYFPPGPPNEGRLSWGSAARQVVDFVRAADYRPFPSPWGHPWTTEEGRKVEVVEAATTGEPTDGAAPGSIERRGDVVYAAARDEWVRVERIRVAGAASPAAEALQAGMVLGR